MTALGQPEDRPVAKRAIGVLGQQRDARFHVANQVNDDRQADADHNAAIQVRREGQRAHERNDADGAVIPVDAPGV